MPGTLLQTLLAGSVVVGLEWHAVRSHCHLPRSDRRLRAVSRKRIERQLVDLAERLSELRSEERICAEQLAQVAAEADDARIRAMVSDSPADRHVHRGAQRAADTLSRRYDKVRSKIADLEARQDELLDEMRVS